MRIKFLGSAAGGGFSQWDFACRNCQGVGDGKIKARPRTETQIAIDSNPEYALRTYWTLINASPDLSAQIAATKELSPFANTQCSTPIREVFLTNADVDSVMGLLHLREFQGFRISSLPQIQR